MSALITWTEDEDGRVHGRGESGSRYLVSAGHVEGSQGWIVEDDVEIIEASIDFDAACRAALQTEALRLFAAWPDGPMPPGRLIGARGALDRLIGRLRAEADGLGWNSRTWDHPCATLLASQLRRLDALSEQLDARIAAARSELRVVDPADPARATEPDPPARPATVLFEDPLTAAA